MKILKWVLCILLVSVVAVGCSKKKQEMTGLSGLGIEGEDKDVITQTISTPETESSVIQPIASQPKVTLQPPIIQPQAEVKTNQKGAKAAPSAPVDMLEKNKQIQTALKNAGLYLGEIDGKIGVLTRKAIEEFQKSNGLKVDGKVGPITWAELKKYLNATPYKTTTPRSQTKKTKW